jgi:hypothetical protein
MAGLRTTRILFILSAAALLLPMVQHALSLFTVAPLNGAVVPAADTHLNLNAWWDGSYQEQKNLYLNDNTGFRPDMVRLNNEIDYRLFGKLHARLVVAGKNNYLYEQGYLDEYTGLEYKSDSTLLSGLVWMKKIQDTLERLGKTVVFVEAASKAWYYPQYAPDGYRYQRWRGTTTYTRHVQLMDSLGIHHIDMNRWFAAQRKDSITNKLFSRTGTHWTVYGSLLVADSLSHYLAQRTGKVFPRLKINRYDYADTARGTDDDIAKGLNLLQKWPQERLCYPDYTFTQPDSPGRKIIFIGDSFLWTLLNNGYVRATGPQWQLWYYFTDAWKKQVPDSGVEKLEHYNWQQPLADAECLVIMYTTINLKSVAAPFSFAGVMHQHFYPAKTTANRQP